MAIVFDSPLFLYGTAAGAIPVLIHLLNRRRAKLRKFPSIRLITESQKKVARHYRIKQRLLLALRVLSIMAIAFFLAGPQLVTRAERGVGGVKKGRAFLIIIDNSFSMSYRAGGGPYIEQAKELARGIMEELQPQARFAAVPLLSAGEAKWTLTPDREAALRTLSEIEIGYGASDMTSALNKAYASLKVLPDEFEKTILIITDTTDLPWKGFSAAGLDFVDRDVKLKVVRLGDGSEAYNTYLSGVSFDHPTVGEPLVIQAELADGSTGLKEPALMELKVDGITVQRRKVGKSSQGPVLLGMEYIASRPGYHKGVLTVSDSQLTEDNFFYFTIPVEERADVLVVDGDPKTSLLLNETYYLTTALDPGLPGERSPIAPRVVTVSEFNRMGPYMAEVIILANVEDLNETARRYLLDYVLGGGNLIFFLGDKVDPGRYNQVFHDSQTRLLPTRLKEVREAPTQLWRVREIDFSHPALSLFQGKEGESLLTARFNRAVEVDEKAIDPETSLLLSLDGGLPLLMERELGRGKVLLFTSTADRDWNDLCTRSAYLPLVQGLVSYLVSDDPLEAGAAGVAGSMLEVPLSVSGTTRAVKVTGPDGRALRAEVLKEGGETLLRFTGPTPGFYRLELPGEERIIALNASREESRLSRISEQELRGKFGEVEIDVISGPAGAEEILLEEGKKVRLSTVLLLSMFLLLGAEGLIANKT